jgi:hypothetical protein
LTQIKEWIALCQHNHGNQVRQCPVKTGASPPTRLIDVEPRDESPIVYLCDTDSLPEPAFALKYATLSHTGGGILAKKLGKESIQEFQRRIRVLGLPKTFREAIHVTRKLSVKYLWVDALCVIQNSDKDWLVESSKVGEIYLESYINLTATASGDSRESLLQMSNLLDSRPCQILVSRPQQAPTTYTCCSKPTSTTTSSGRLSTIERGSFKREH